MSFSNQDLTALASSLSTSLGVSLAAILMINGIVNFDLLQRTMTIGLSGSSLLASTLSAQSTQTPTAPLPTQAPPGLNGQPTPGLMESLLSSPISFMMIAFALLYLMVIRPQQRAAKAQQQELADSLKNLKKNDRVVTIGGVHAIVVNASADSPTVTLRVDESNNTTMTFSREAIAKVVLPKPKET